MRLDIKSEWHISEVAEEIDRINSKCEDKSGKVVAKEARRTVVVKSGELKRSIKEGKGIITALADHAKYIELGTYKMRAQPFLRPALINMGRKIVIIFKEGFE